MKRKIVFIGVLIVLCSFVAVSTSSATILQSGFNRIEFTNLETVFDSSGNEKSYLNDEGQQVDPGIEVGDFFVGIFDVQRVTDITNVPTWESSSSQRISGLFVQEVVNIYGPGLDPYSPTQNDPHIVLGSPTRNTFTTLEGDTFSTGLTGNEQFAFYLDSGSTTFYTGNGSIAADITAATDDTLLYTFGMGPGPDGNYETSDDTGYSYTHGNLGALPQNFAAENWFGLQAIQINEPYTFFGTNDLNEQEVIFDENGDFAGYLPAGFLVDVYATSSIEINQGWFGTGNNGATSDWVFSSEDPAETIGTVVPEPGTVLLLGIGLLGIAGIARRKT